MSLETGTYISDLNSANPVGTDVKSQGDDHIRLLKSTILATFPSITGAVTATHTELNLLDGVTATTAELNTLDGITASVTELNYTDGVTSAIQTQLDAKLATSGLLTAMLAVDGAGSGLDADLLDGSQGSAFAKIASSNTFSASQIVTSASTPYVNVTASADSTYASVNVGNSADGDNGALKLGVSGSAASFDAGHAWIYTNSGYPLDVYVNAGVALAIDTSKNFDFKAGTVTTNNASPDEVGFKGAPPRDISAPTLADCGKLIRMSGNVTIPANASVAFPVGTVLSFYNNAGASKTIAVTSDTIELAGTALTGTRTLADNGLATFVKVTSTKWVASGAGLS